MNLLTNPSFNDGHHHQNDVPELVVPDGWHLDFLDGEHIPTGSDQPARRPESVVWNKKDAPEHEKDIFFLEGQFCLKVFKPSAPVYFALSQEVTGLTPGATYRFTAQVYPDIVAKYENGKKQRPGDIWAAEARAGWSAPDTSWPKGHSGDVNWGGWFNVNNGNFAFGEWGDVFVEFVAPAGGSVRVWVECKAKWGFENNWFMDDFSLEPVSGHVPSEDDTQPKPKPKPGEGEGGPETSEDRGAPREQYVRTYILLPTDVDPEMAQAAMRVALGRSITVGFVPDDAGIGDLDRRRVICVNPDRIGTGMGAWFNQFYPGVEYIAITADNAGELEAKLSRVV
jgi:hypothetical protein